MKAMIYEQFGSTPSIERVDDPICPNHGAIIQVKASGVCRSDWHGWQGHDPDIVLPHVPGHEFAGEIVEVGKDVTQWKIGERVAVPFIAGCGKCIECKSGNQQVCADQTQPGFTHWGSFAEYTFVNQVDNNLVTLPETINYETAASLGCRFATAFRAVMSQGKLRPGQWIAVHGCGGVGLSAIMIAKAVGARVVAIDIMDEKLQLAKQFAADLVINASQTDNLVEAIKDQTNDSVEVSIDALGSRETCLNSIRCLKARGRHVQVGLIAGDDSDTKVPLDLVLAKELEVVGSHGMPAPSYAEMLKMISGRQLKPELLVQKTVSLQEAINVLCQMHQFENQKVTLINRFE